MSATVQIVIRAIDKASKDLGKTNKSFADLGKVVGTTAAVFAGMAIAAREAWQTIGEGLVISQTAESFDLLISKIGAAPDLLNRLNDAAGGTISKMELMSSTATLLAGTSGELATSLANSTPQLLEIARAANKLNPSLGTTTQMYESLALGIKRSSPLILDNLGLTIKIGEANNKYAASLGKSVAELTAAEKQQALLNETLRAGGVLIDQVGGNVDAAGDSYARLSTIAQDTTDGMKSSVAEALLPAIDGWSQYADAHKKVTEAEKAGLVTREEIFEIHQKADSYVDSWVSKLQLIEDRERMAANATAHHAQMTELMRGELQAVDTVANEYADRAKDAASASYAAGAAMRENAAAASGLGGELAIVGKKYSEISTSVFSMTQSLQDNLNFIAAGGGALLELTNTAQQAMDAGNFDGAQEALDAAALGAIDLDLELDKIDAAEAESRLTEQLGYPPKAAKEKVAELQSTLFALTSKTYTININANITGSKVVADAAGGVVGGTSGKEPGAQEFATGTGGWQKVPGTTSTPVPITVHGGESINVVPAGRSVGGSGGGGSVTFSGDIIFLSADEGMAFVAAQQRNAARDTRSAMAGSSYAG